MPSYRIEFEREIVETERVVRVITAASQEEADAKASAMASGFDRDCPDDNEPIGGPDCQSWRPSRVSPAGPLDGPASDEEEA